jgi:uncharacterized protein YbbC (DUF1343 family)
MRSLEAATLYPGVGLIEMANISVGRGTDTPFSLVGAPWVDAARLQRSLWEEKLSGVDFVITEFTPTASVFAKQLCHGVKLVVFDRDHFAPVSLGIALAAALQKQSATAFKIEKMATLVAHPGVLTALTNGKSRKEIEALWKTDFAEFTEHRKAFLRYP